MDPPVDVAREDTDSDVTSGFEGTTLVGDSTEGYDSGDLQAGCCRPLLTQT